MNDYSPDREEVQSFPGKDDKVIELLGVGTGVNHVQVYCGHCGWKATFPAKLFQVAYEEYNNHECTGEDI